MTESTVGRDFTASHRVRIRLLRVTSQGVVDPQGSLWMQWEAVCVCGWRCLSWKWADVWRGVLPVSLDHLSRGGPP